MTLKEAQSIVDNITSKTIIDPGWLDYLLEEKGLITLQALQLVTERSYKELLEKYEGCDIDVFQTENITYVGRVLSFNNWHSLIISEDREYLYYFDTKGEFESIGKYIIKELGYVIK